MSKVIFDKTQERDGWYRGEFILNPVNPRPYGDDVHDAVAVPGPCDRCRSRGCNPAIFCVQEDDGRQVPVCFECLSPEEEATVRADEARELAENKAKGKPSFYID